MGQKIHPSGFRVGITKKHQSQWFARFNKNKYSQTVLEDRMIRDTLHKLFPELLNPTSKLENKREQNANVKKARITQIKIERNIVPYEIGIQIHAENCKLLKSTIKNLQVKREIIVKLQKTRQYLTNLKTKLDNLTNNPLETRLKTNGNSNQEHRPKKQDGTKLSKIKSLRKKLSNIKASNTKLWESSSRKKLSKSKLAFGTKQTNSLSKRSMGLGGNNPPRFARKKTKVFSNQLGLQSQGVLGAPAPNPINKLFQIKLLRAKLSKFIQMSPPPCKTSSIFNRGEGANRREGTKRVGFARGASLPLPLKGDFVVTPPSGPLRVGFAKGSKKKQDFTESLKKKSKFVALHAKLTKRQLKRQRIFKKRLRLRKFIRLRDRLAISKGLFIQKRGRVGFARVSCPSIPFPFLATQERGRAAGPLFEKEGVKRARDPLEKQSFGGLRPYPTFVSHLGASTPGRGPIAYRMGQKKNSQGQKIIKKLLLSPTPRFLKDFSLVAKSSLLPPYNMGLLYPRLNLVQGVGLGGVITPAGDKNPPGPSTPYGGRKKQNFSRGSEGFFGRAQKTLQTPRYPKPGLNFSNYARPPLSEGGKKGGGPLALQPIKKNQSNFKANIYNSRLQKKIVTLYIEQMKRKFLPHLNDLFIQYTNQKSLGAPAPSWGRGPRPKNVLSLGYLKKWNFKLGAKNLKTQSIEKLNRLIQKLRENFVMKLNRLRKEFIAFGSFSCNSSEILGLFQLYNFVIKLKDLVNDLKRNLKHNIKTRLAISKMSGPEASIFQGALPPAGVAKPYNFKALLRNQINSTKSINTRSAGKGLALQEDKETSSVFTTFPPPFRGGEERGEGIPLKVFRKKLDNISNECRKMKFIEYLKDLVKKHRTDNIYLYLASLSESRKKLKEIKNELKENLDFYLPETKSLINLIKTRKNESSGRGPSPLYPPLKEGGKRTQPAPKLGLQIQGGLGAPAPNPSSDAINQVDSIINQQVNKILLKLTKKHPFEKTFSDCKLEELERRKTMWFKNLQLTPKISIQFFSVNPNSLNQKASVVSESVVDALEKRKAFRKVIKSTKEKLMRNPEIKGVKIQVAGRLNGAEIARTEWVRAGRVPLQTLRANLDYSYRTANTIYGIIGIKVWIFKGFTKLISPRRGE